MSTVINFKSDVSQRTTEFESLPEGRYNVKIESCEVKNTSKGDPMIAVTMNVIDPKFNNRKLWHNLTLSSKALPFVLKFLKAIGSDLIEQDGVTPERIIADIKGKYCSVYATPSSTPAGKPKNDVSDFLPYTPDINEVGAATPHATTFVAPVQNKDLFS